MSPATSRSLLTWGFIVLLVGCPSEESPPTSGSPPAPGWNEAKQPSKESRTLPKSDEEEEPHQISIELFLTMQSGDTKRVSGHKLFFIRDEKSKEILSALRKIRREDQIPNGRLPGWPKGSSADLRMGSPEYREYEWQRATVTVARYKRHNRMVDDLWHLIESEPVVGSCLTNSEGKGTVSLAPGGYIVLSRSPFVIGKNRHMFMDMVEVPSAAPVLLTNDHVEYSRQLLEIQPEHIRYMEDVVKRNQ